MGDSRPKEEERGITEDNSEGMNTKGAIEFDDIDAQKFLYYMAKDDSKNKEKYNAVSKLILLLLNKKSQREKRGYKFERMFRDVENMYGSSLTWDIEQKYFPKEK